MLALHRRLSFWRIKLDALTPYHVACFLERPGGVQLRAPAQRRYQRRLRWYLDWLWRRRLILVDPGALAPARRGRRPPPPPPPLSAPAGEFLAELAATLRLRTCDQYRHHLRAFHAWLTADRRTLRTLTRGHMCRWLQHLHARVPHPATRLYWLLQVRTYLRWLAERDLLRADPDDLLRRSDLPKLPSYLPRPLPPALDRTLQRHLTRSRATFAQALLLMRQTGVRSGELLRLDYDCLRRDPQRHPFLKVPLGKLYTERLVPLAPRTVALVQRLQRQGPHPRAMLLPTTAAGQPAYERLCAALRTATCDLHDSQPITTHRLRHTYATELLAAGMSLLGIMRLLGHRDFRMTLRYTAITQETVGKEYHQALAKLAAKYRLPVALAPDLTTDPCTLCEHLARWLRQHGHANRPLLRRLERLQHDLASLAPTHLT